mgnify:CR=1 FL=1
MSNEKINIEENIENTGEIEIPGSGQWGVPFCKADAAFDLIEDRYKHLVDDTYLSGFDVEEYFENSLRMHNASKNDSKRPGILSALLG